MFIEIKKWLDFRTQTFTLCMVSLIIGNMGKTAFMSSHKLLDHASVICISLNVKATEVRYQDF